MLLWGSRIVVPPRMRSCVLDELHETHQGIVKMKGCMGRKRGGNVYVHLHIY